MSLAVLADHMASKGRGPDSMLIHMSPNEVAGLQALANQHGGSLTINPETGLPEAGFLDKLLPTIIGAGISYFSGGTIDPMTAATIVGGVETARTGDIGRGLQAGLGAYGGAGLTAGMSAAGTGALTAEAAAIAGTDIAAMGAAQGYSPELIAAMQQQAIDEAALQGGAQFTAGESLSKGFDLAKANPMQAIKDYGKPLMYAAGPAILAAASTEEGMPKTVTKPGMIRPYSYNPYSGGFVGGTPYEAAPTKSAGGGLMGLAAGGMAGYGDGDDVPRRIDNGMAQGGMYDFAQRSEPVVRMAEGGIAGYANGALVSDQQIFDYFAKPTSGRDDAQIARDMQTYNVTAADIARATGTGARQGEYESRFVQAINKPDTSAAEFQAMTADVGLQNQALENAMDTAGMSQAAQYAATHNLTDTKAPQTDFYNQFGYKLGALPGDQGGLEGFYSNINYSAQGLQSLINAGKMTGQQAREAALTEMNRIGMSAADLKAATGKTLAELFPDTKTKIDTKVTGTGTGTGTDTTIIPGVNDYGLGGTGTSGALEDVLGTALPPGVSGAGITTVNPNGTITTRPNIPGIPEGGFTGMTSLRDAYTKGGGSLGYVPYTPKSLKEVEDKYSITGGSKQSYDYLMGKTPYSPTPYTKTGEVMKPYGESVLGMPIASSSKMYLFDPATKTYKINPDYAIPTYDKDGKKSYNLTNKDVVDFMGTAPSSDAFFTWATTNNLSPEQISAATGRSISEISKMFTGGKKESDIAKGGDTIQVTDSSGYDTQTYTATKQSDGTYLASNGKKYDADGKEIMAAGGLAAMARGGMAQQFNLGDYSDGGRLLRGPGDGVSDSIPATIGNKRPARLADGEFVVPARIVSELGNGSTEAGARKLYAMMDRIQSARRGTVGKGKVAKNSRSEKYLPA